MYVYMPRRPKKKSVCGVGFGCPEWRHCINVLGDGDKRRPKETLKRMKKCGSRSKTYKKCMVRERKKAQRQRKKTRRQLKNKRRKSRRHTRKKRGGERTISSKISLEELKKLLSSHGIVEQVPTLDANGRRQRGPDGKTMVENGTWGENGTKSVDKLLQEIKKGETILKEINGGLFRTVRRVVIEIFNNESKTHILQEAGHYNKIGGVLIKAKSNKDLREKMSVGEKPYDALIRAVTEELGAKYLRQKGYFKGSPKFRIEKGKIIYSDSWSYPGLPMHTTEFKEEMYLPLLTEDMNAPPRDELWVKELNEDKSFKRWIKWKWVST